MGSGCERARRLKTTYFGDALREKRYKVLEEAFLPLTTKIFVMAKIFMLNLVHEISQKIIWESQTLNFASSK